MSVTHMYIVIYIYIYIYKYMLLQNYVSVTAIRSLLQVKGKAKAAPPKKAMKAMKTKSTQDP
jgi:hypothetical protein